MAGIENAGGVPPKLGEALNLDHLNLSNNERTGETFGCKREGNEPWHLFLAIRNGGRNSMRRRAFCFPPYRYKVVVVVTHLAYTRTMFSSNTCTRTIKLENALQLIDGWRLRARRAKLVRSCMLGCVQYIHEARQQQICH